MCFNSFMVLGNGNSLTTLYICCCSGSSVLYIGSYNIAFILLQSSQPKYSLIYLQCSSNNILFKVFDLSFSALQSSQHILTIYICIKNISLNHFYKKYFDNFGLQILTGWGSNPDWLGFNPCCVGVRVLGAFPGGFP